MLMRESDIRLSSYQMNSLQMYRSGQPIPNDSFNSNMYAMPPNYRMPAQFPGNQYPGHADASGPPSIDDAAMHAHTRHAQLPQTMQQFYPNRYSFSPVEGQLGQPQSYPANGHEQQQFHQPSAAIPHPQQFPQQVAMNNAPPSLGYQNNGEVVGAQYGQMPAYYGHGQQQQNPSDTMVKSFSIYFHYFFLVISCFWYDFGYFLQVFGFLFPAY